MTLNRLWFQLIRLGWPGALGFGLLVLALLADRALIVPLEKEAAEQRLAAARQLAAPVIPPPAKPAAPPRATEEAVLKSLFAAAHQHGLVLDEGRYTLGGGAYAKRLRIDLPISGSYPALRGFLADALEGNPALTLETLELSRDTIEATELEAHPRFLLNLEAAP
jgi:hypothetical protein